MQPPSSNPANQFLAPRAEYLAESSLSISEHLANTCAEFGSRTALECGSRTLTYAQLADRIETIAQGLLDAGVRAGDRVSIILPMCLEAVVSFHATLRIGAVAVQHSAREPMAQLAKLFDDYSPVAAIISENRLEALAGITSESLPKTVLSVTPTEDSREFRRLLLPDTLVGFAKAGGRGVLRAATGPQKIPASLNPRHIHTMRFKDMLASKRLPKDYPYPRSGQLATIVYPQRGKKLFRGSMLTHANLCAVACLSLAWLKDSEPGTEVAYAHWSLHSPAGIADTLTTSLVHGRHNFLFPRFDTAALTKALKSHPPTVVSGDPHVFDFLLERAHSGAENARGIRFMFTKKRGKVRGSAHAENSAALGCPIVVCHTIPEAPVVTGFPTSTLAEGESVGIPFPRTEIRIVDRRNRGQVLPIGHIGRVMVKGPQVFHGYWNRPDETAAALSVDGWVLTNDLGSIDSRGLLTLVRKGETPR